VRSRYVPVRVAARAEQPGRVSRRRPVQLAVRDGRAVQWGAAVERREPATATRRAQVERVRVTGTRPAAPGVPRHPRAHFQRQVRASAPLLLASRFLRRFEEDPPYGAIRTLFVSLMQRQSISEHHPYDWEEGGAFHAEVFSKIEVKRQMLRQQMDQIT